MNRFTDFDLGTKTLSPIYGYYSCKLVSLEQSLIAILPYIDQLSRYIKVAKQHCHFPSEHGLTRDESAAVYLYTMEWGKGSFYRVLNQALRSEDRSKLKPWFPFLKLFEVAIEKLPSVKKAIWRGVQKDLSEKLKKDQILTWWAVNSCSSSVDVIKGFVDINSTLFLIEAVNGRNIKGYTNFDNEDELILMPGTRLQVESNALNHLGGLHVIHLRELSDNSDEQLASAIVQVHLPPTASDGTAQHTDDSKKTPNFVPFDQKKKSTKTKNETLSNYKPKTQNDFSMKPKTMQVDKHKKTYPPNGNQHQWVPVAPNYLQELKTSVNDRLVAVMPNQSQINITNVPLLARQYRDTMSSQSLSVKPNRTSFPTVSPNHAQTYSNATNHAEQYPVISNHSMSSQVYNQNLSYVAPNSIQIVNYPDGRYEGTFQNGLRQGHGSFDCNNCGHKYVGSWVNDKPNGQGVSVWPNGSRYDGNWKDGLKDGYGTFHCGDCGHIYVGNFIKDLMHGHGIFTSREGWQYQGSWMNDKKHGWGTMTFANGMVTSGNWFNDTYMN
ncbi:unnamed protein product [Rotaria socialis]|uniref:NAD(P)(+)--arginine ADP-ribosyltransferase n=1 Tax=Rotaria socialis TaxID=392032 RepID=A0A821AGH4_9BILA|nr:unnamed protein product [Rotaria socialis]